MTESRRTRADHARVYVDMVGDLFHMGHVEFLKAAREFGDWLVVGVLSDEVASAYKRRPIMTLAERVAVVEACRYVDEVVPNAPYIVTTEFLDEHDISLVVHGDDISQDHRGGLRSGLRRWQAAAGEVRPESRPQTSSAGAGRRDVSLRRSIFHRPPSR